MSPRSISPTCLILVFLFIVGTGFGVEPPGDEPQKGPDAQEPEFRTWTDITNKYKVEGQFTDFKAGKVHLKRTDGNVITVPIGKLSKQDQEWVKSHGRTTGRKRTDDERQRSGDAVTAKTNERMRAETAQYFSRINLAHQACLAGNVPRAEQLLDACPSQFRHWEWGYLKRLCHSDTTTLGGHVGEVMSVALSPDGGRVAAGVDDTVKIWDVTTRKEVCTVRGYGAGGPGVWFGMGVVTFSPDGNRIAFTADDGSVKISDAASGKETLVLQAARNVNAYISVTFSPDGERIACGGVDASLRICNAATGKEMFVLRGQRFPIPSVGFSPNGARIASGSYDGSVKIWDTAKGREILTLRRDTMKVFAIAFTPDGRNIASASLDKTVTIWDCTTGAPLLTLRGHNDTVGTIAFSPDGKRIASGSLDKTIKIWETATGRELLTLREHLGGITGVAFSRSGKRLVSGGDKTVKIWDAASWKESDNAQAQ